MGGSVERIRAEFAKRQERQSVAISAAMLLVIVFAILYARPGWLGPNSRGTIFFAQIVVITTFIGFTYHNWRYPSCNRHLGGELHRRMCSKCRAQLH